MVQVDPLELNSVHARPLTASPEKYPQGKFKNKACRKCRLLFNPVAPSQHYCSDRCRKLAMISKRYERLHGITGEDAAELFNEQGGLCKICGGEGFKMHKNKKHGLNLDHCHKTGKVRGWLCDNCNRGLGLLQDDITVLEAAIDYIRSNEEST